jgi:hypothetical protein
MLATQESSNTVLSHIFIMAGGSDALRVRRDMSMPVRIGPQRLLSDGPGGR